MPIRFFNFVEGLNILRGYYDCDFIIYGELDTFRVRSTDRPVSQEDYNSLLKLGWKQPMVSILSGYDRHADWGVFISRA